MKDNFIKYNIEDIINQKLYEEKIIDENTYTSVKNKILRLLYELNYKSERKEYKNDLI